MCTGAYRGRGVSRVMCTYAITLSFFMFFSDGALFCCRILTLSSFKKDVFVRNGSISVVMK